MNTQLKHFLRGAAIAAASLALAGGAMAQSHRGGGHFGGGHFVHAPVGHWHGGRPGWYGPRGSGYLWGGVGLGLGLGLASYYASPWYADPGYVIVDPPPPTTVYSTVQPRPVPAPQPSQPVIYPRNGQSAAQTDADSDACSQWAGAQRNASSDPSVFQRGITACMDARGYTVR